MRTVSRAAPPETNGLKFGQAVVRLAGLVTTRRRAWTQAIGISNFNSQTRIEGKNSLELY